LLQNINDDDDDGHDRVDGVRLIYELLPPTGLLFIPQVIYDYGEPRWNCINRRKLLIHPPELFGSPTSRVI
jgi:hypothetical protein